MTAHEQLANFATKHGIKLIPVTKVKVKKGDVSNATKQKDLILTIAKDLGYLE